MIYKTKIDNYCVIQYAKDEEAFKRAVIQTKSGLNHNRYQNVKLQTIYNDFKGKEIEFIVVDPNGKREDIPHWVSLLDPKYVLNGQGFKTMVKPVKKEKEITILHKPDLSNIEQMSECELDVAINYYVRLGWNNLSPEDKINWGRINKVIASKRIFSQDHYLELQVTSILGEFNKESFR